MRFPYMQGTHDPTSLMPRMPLSLIYNNQMLEVVGLVDTGSAVNVLPYRAGLALGAIWEQQTQSVDLVGSLGRFEAKALVLLGTHPALTPTSSVRLVFAWTRAEDAPVIFGQMNFFLEFDVCFYRSQGFFEVSLKMNP